MSAVSETGSIDDWIKSTQRQYPELPNQLTLDVELEYIAKLRQWREAVRELRTGYKDGTIHVPEKYENVPGDSQVIPALMSIRIMSDIERDSWHRLFSCAAPQLAHMTMRYWTTHTSDSCTLTVQDPLNYLPIVFLYILSTYDEHRQTKDYKDDFSSRDGRVRLTTWIFKQSQYHINTYLQSAAYVIGSEPNYVHTLKSKIRDLDNQSLVQKGRTSTSTELVELLPDLNYYANNLSEEKLRERIEEIRVGNHSVSLDAPFGSDKEDENYTYKRVLSDTPSAANEADAADGYEYVLSKTEGNDTLQRACLKILETDEKLTPQEQFVFG